jgi:hypothetical protein
MPRISLVYNCHVYVTVDTASNEVTRVQVDDEGIVLNKTRDPRHMDLSDCDKATPKQVRQAFQIAEAAEWPAWHFGF